MESCELVDPTASILVGAREKVVTFCCQVWETGGSQLIEKKMVDRTPLRTNLIVVRVGRGQSLPAFLVLNSAANEPARQHESTTRRATRGSVLVSFEREQAEVVVHALFQLVCCRVDPSCYCPCLKAHVGSVSSGTAARPKKKHEGTPTSGSTATVIGASSSLESSYSSTRESCRCLKSTVYVDYVGERALSGHEVGHAKRPFALVALTKRFLTPVLLLPPPPARSTVLSSVQATA